MNIALVVDDDRTQRQMVSSILEDELGMRVLHAQNGQDCLKMLRTRQAGQIKLVTLDLEMPVMDGFETLPEIIKRHAHIPVLVITGSESAEKAADAMKLGARDFFSKPISRERILASVRNALKIGMLSEEVSRLERHADGGGVFSDLIGAENGLSGVMALAKKAARSEVAVCIQGETGTGKEVFARAIHGESERSGKAFVAVNCGAIPESLVESTLFGHEKGSFTGAIRNAAGKFREADGGTIFLDEVGELPPDTQVKLLRVLQEQEIEPVGAAKSVSVDVRVVSATNRDLEEEVAQGRFREDLYFRLNVLPMHLPPLRERVSDIADLTEHFVARHAIGMSAGDYRGVQRVSSAAIKKLMRHSWPGNVRELENTIQRSMILCDGHVLDSPNIHFFSSGSKTQSVLVESGAIAALDEEGELYSLAEMERAFFEFALSHCDHNIARAAREIGVAKSTFYRKLNQRLSKAS